MTQQKVAENKISVVAGEITRYLANKPDAAETVDGIAKWWLTRQRFEDSKEVVMAALEHLVIQGILSKQVSGGKAIYRKIELEYSAAYK